MKVTGRISDLAHNRGELIYTEIEHQKVRLTFSNGGVTTEITISVGKNGNLDLTTVHNIDGEIPDWLQFC